MCFSMFWYACNCILLLFSQPFCIYRKLHPRLSSTFNHNRQLDTGCSYRPTQSSKENSTKYINQSDDLNDLSVWEKWLVAKLKVEKEKSKIKVSSLMKLKFVEHLFGVSSC